VKLPRFILIGGKLAIICIVAAVVLGLINAVTAPVIVANREKALLEGLTAIAAGADLAGPRVGEAVSATESEAVAASDEVQAIYPLVTSDGEVGGYVLQLVGTGYGGDMNILAGYYPTGELFAARLMENQETPGLGKKAEDPAYMNKFVGTGGDSRVPTSPSELSPDQADAITGATITFLGVARALEAGSEFVQSDGQAIARSTQ
jgi:electron transport complex protein RnfG